MLFNYKYNLYHILLENQFIPLMIDDKVVEEPFHFKDEWYPTEIDWNIMVKNMNDHASLHNIFSRIKNVNKLIRYYLIAKALCWPNIDDYYDNYIYSQLLYYGLKFDEIHLIEDENPVELIPEDINGLIENLLEYDKLGGIALRDLDLGDFIDDKNVFNALKGVEDIESCEFMRLTTDYKKAINNIRIIKLSFINGSIAYIRIDKFGKNCYHFKSSYTSSNRNINGERLKTCMYIDMYQYLKEKIIDNDYTPNWL